MFQKYAHQPFQYTVELPAEPVPGSRLLEIRQLCRVGVRRLDEKLSAFDLLQNYQARPPESDLVLEATLFLSSKDHPKWTSVTVGIALSEVPEVRRFSVQYTGTSFRLLGGGRLLDENWTFGETLCQASGAEALTPVEEHARDLTRPMQFWNPDGINAWVGDVTTAYVNGVFHLFYLFDRRHHTSGFQTGKHQWGHLSTRDFKTWRDDGIILPIEHERQSFGTGTPFELNGQIALAYGIHSERYGDHFPAGATWATTVDGEHFTPTDVLFAETRNPSIYTDLGEPFTMYCGFAEGGLKMMTADRWPDFHPAAENLVPSGPDTAGGNNLDCPCVFRWHGFCYMLVGFRGMWRSTTPDFQTKIDLVDREEDLYDGMQVPMVTRVGDRRIAAGWLPHQNGHYGEWGGVLLLRELVWFDDGIPGMRWLPEAVPAYPEQREFSGGAVPQEFLLEIDAEPGEDLVIALTGNGKQVEFRYFAGERRAELTFAGVRGQTLKEAHAEKGEFDTTPAVRNLRRTDRPFTVRLLVSDQRKMAGAIVDAEIAGCRTIVSHFPDAHFEECRAVQGTPRAMKIHFKDKE